MFKYYIAATLALMQSIEAGFSGDEVLSGLRDEKYGQ